MSGTKISTASLLILLSGAAYAADPDYFPLHVGNQWVYESKSLQREVEVTKIVTFGDSAYLLYSGLEGQSYLRQTEDGVLYAYDPQTKSEALVAPFNSGDGVFTPFPNPCGQTGKIASRTAKYKGPIGEFDNALEIQYSPGRCADAGVEKEVYLPWIGLVQRTSTTIAGPRTYDLVYARIGGVTVVSGPEVSFGIALHQGALRLTIRNTQAEPLSLQFNSGQMYDVAISNDKGEQVYLWSRGKFFTQIVQTVQVQGEKNWTVTVPLTDLPAGQYTLEAWLTTAGPRSWTASMPLEVR